MTTTANIRPIQLVRISHVYYTHKNIEKARKFLEDFGFEEVKHVGTRYYYRGTGPDPFVYCAEEGDENKFGGAAFIVESKEELDYAAETLPNATSVHEMRDEPGGGLRVTFLDPIDRFPFHLICNQTPKTSTEPTGTQLDFNYPMDKYRRENNFQRFQKAPAPVHKLGHFGMCVTNFEKSYEFYTTRFNFAPSDLVYDKTGKDVATFLHLDRGAEPVDHHCFFVFNGPVSHVHHSSFETRDFDTQLLGHDWLRERGYENCWGVGRHVLGSQIFDYWFDPSGFIVEHYVDGDLVNSKNPVKRSPEGPETLYVWGPDLPQAFLE